MNAKQAYGLLVVGILMKAVPALAPDWFPPTGPDGTNASAIWLQYMGAIEITIAAWQLIRHHWVPALRRRALNPKPARTAMPAAAVRQPRTLSP